MTAQRPMFSHVSQPQNRLGGWVHIHRGLSFEGLIFLAIIPGSSVEYN